MNPILDHLIKTEFRDLAGTTLEGQIALSDELVNLGLTDLLRNLTSTAPAGPPKETTAGDAAAPAPPDPKALLAHATVHHLKYRTEAGRTVLEIKAEL